MSAHMPEGCTVVTDSVTVSVTETRVITFAPDTVIQVERGNLIVDAQLASVAVAFYWSEVSQGWFCGAGSTKARVRLRLPSGKWGAEVTRDLFSVRANYPDVHAATIASTPDWTPVLTGAPHHD